MPHACTSDSTGGKVIILAVAVLCVSGGLMAPGCAGRTARVGLDSEDDALLGTMGSKDFRSVCFDMGQSLVRLPQIQRAESPPTVAFTEVLNNSDEIFETDDLLYKIRAELMQNCAGKIRFLDRDIKEEVLQERRDKRLGKVTSSGDRPVYGADFFLTGRVESIRRSRGRTTTSYMRFAFRLTDANTTAIVWEDDYEIKKLHVRGVYDR